MNMLRIKSGRIEVRRSNGILVRMIGNGDAVFADFSPDQSLIAITTVRGKVEIRRENGVLVRTLGNGDVSSARWNGSNIAIYRTNGQIELRGETGVLIRVFR